jgi:hypothetical protein
MYGISTFCEIIKQRTTLWNLGFKIEIGDSVIGYVWDLVWDLDFIRGKISEQAQNRTPQERSAE